MIIIGRRVIPIEGLPGETVTMRPFTLEEFQAYRRAHAGDLMDQSALWELVVSHIEAHPFDVADPREIEIRDLAPIIETWTTMLAAATPVRGRRH